ncbi:RNA polymerase sigma factor [Microbacterium sulfonylureivorans]|uniref:RNA polymerase sigma factor n=1 Tax=Microbacterium sulfonylureivorans TaxID=2486854 RepID=UPI001F0CC795|nr:RNA polymerase sigma factor [Microbacterium sulfonylureivorans]
MRAIAQSSGDLLAYFEYRVSRDEAPDLLVETMTAAWRHANNLPAAAEEARMWLFGIARNVLANAQRSGRRRVRLANRLRDMLATGTTVGPPADTGLEVRDAVNRLADHHAEIIRLVHWDGFSLVDAAKLCGIPESTARSRYQAAKRQLREALSPQLVEQPTAS